MRQYDKLMSQMEKALKTANTSTDLTAKRIRIMHEYLAMKYGFSDVTAYDQLVSKLRNDHGFATDLIELVLKELIKVDEKVTKREKLTSSPNLLSLQKIAQAKKAEREEIIKTMPRSNIRKRNETGGEITIG